MTTIDISSLKSNVVAKNVVGNIQAPESKNFLKPALIDELVKLKSCLEPKSFLARLLILYAVSSSPEAMAFNTSRPISDTVGRGSGYWFCIPLLYPYA